MTCPKCTNGEILSPKGHTIRTCTCLMGILQKALYVANTDGSVWVEVFGVLGNDDKNTPMLGVGS